MPVVRRFAVKANKTQIASTSQKIGMEFQESSGNFDLENVRPFLERIKRLIESGFSDAEINQIQEAAEEMEVDEEKVFEFPIKFKGSVTVLQVKVFMDDVAAPDVYFFTDSELAEEIDKQMRKFFDDLGI